MDWTVGRWGKGKFETRITIASDWIPRNAHKAIILNDPTGVYGDMLEVLRDSDLRIVNLECPLVDDGIPLIKSGPSFKAPPQSLASLDEVPFEVVCLANNHMLDYGTDGLDRTMDLLGNQGMYSVGAGLSEAEAYAPRVVRVGRTQIGIVNFCEGENNTFSMGGAGTFGWDLVRVVDTVRTLREQVDVVLVIGHCGCEFLPVPPPYVLSVFRLIARAGAHAVMGHHPHVPQGLEIYNGVPIFYSLGNFVFHQKRDLFYRRMGYTVRLDVLKKELVGFQITPYLILPEGLQRAKSKMHARILSRLHCVSNIIEDEVDVHRVWEAFIDWLGSELWMAEFIKLKRFLNHSADDLTIEAARLRNIFTTPAHRELCVAALTRMIQGTMGTSPRWAQDLVKEWHTQTLENWRLGSGSM